MSPRQTGRRGRCPGRALGRPGFTLLELLLVLTILVAMAALVIPELMRPLDGQRLARAGERMSMTLSRARTLAIDTGETVTLTLALQGNEYGLSTANGQTFAGEPTQQLLEEASFDSLTIESASVDGNAPAPPANVASGPAIANQAPGLAFYPDGTSDSAQIVLRDATGSRLLIRVRGLTGQAYVGEVVRPAEQQR